MLMREIHYSKQAAKFLAKQTKNTQNRIISAILLLPAGDVKKLKNQPHFRLRVGDFRVIFNDDGFVIEIYKIDNRGQIYK